MFPFFSILFASFLGSPHCAAMCGGFVLLYGSDARKSIWPHVFYNLGRLVTYSFLGLLAGFLGQSLDRFGSEMGLARISAVVLGVFILSWGLKDFLSLNIGLHGKLLFLFTKISSPVRDLLKNNSGKSVNEYAFIIGLISTLLPCGFLYTFVSLAAAGGSTLFGLVLMFAFWVGTLPMMLGLGKFSSAISPRLRQLAPKFSAVFMMLAGIACIFGHFEPPAMIMGEHCSMHSSK